MRRLLVLLLTVVVAWLGWLLPAAAAAPLSLAAIATHSYDAPAIPTSLVGARVQRGPPTATYDYTAHDAVDRWSPGASARSGDATPPAIYNYDDTARFVRTTLGSHGVVWRASVDGTGVDVVQLTSVAAKSAALTEREIGSTMDDVLDGASFFKQAKATQYTKPGGFSQANSDFDALTRGVEVIDRGGGLRTATLSNGTKVNVRPFSSGNDITLEVVTPGNPALKIRYAP